MSPKNKDSVIIVNVDQTKSWVKLNPNNLSEVKTETVLQHLPKQPKKAVDLFQM